MERCIILDASSVIRKVTKRILSSKDMLVIEAETAAQALSMSRLELPHYVIIDSAVSDMKSDDLIRQLRQMDKDGHMKIISCMTQMDLVSMTRAKRAGADEFLLKPFDRKQLLQQFAPIKKAA